MLVPLLYCFGGWGFSQACDQLLHDNRAAFDVQLFCAQILRHKVGWSHSIWSGIARFVVSQSRMNL